MRYDVKKILFIGVDRDRDTFFKRAQDAGIVHFITPKSSSSGEVVEVKCLINAIKVLRGLPTMAQEEIDNDEIAEGFLAEKIVSLNGRLTELLEEQKSLTLDISRVEVFGDFSKEDVAYIEHEGKRKIQFYCAKQGFADHPDLSAELIYTGSDHGLDYFVGINKAITQYPKMVEMVIDRPLGELKERLKEVNAEIDIVDKRLKGYAKYNTFLHHALVKQFDHYQLTQAKSNVEFPLEKESLFAVEGWVPVHQMDAVQSLVTEMNVDVEEIARDDKEIPPTFLENTGVARIGEDLVEIYDTPSSSDKDPSMWVLVFFAIFFSMIVSDAGYGLILLAVAFYLRYKNRALKGFKQRMLKLLFILAIGVTVWGVLLNEYFGIHVAPDSTVNKVSVMNWLVEKKTAYHMEHQDDVYKEWVVKYPTAAKATTPMEMLKSASEKHGNKMRYEMFLKFTDNILMELALFVGVFHIILSMLLNLRRNWSYVGWIIFLIGAYLYVPYFLGATSLVNYAFGLDQQAAAHNGIYMICGGLAVAIGLALYQHKLFGLVEVAHIVQIFGDVLSYLRLYALGLAGVLLASTMIDLASGVPFVFGILILIFGNTVNLILGIMGGVIHGLRLNFLEWYHYCFEGGGKQFTPLKKHEIE
jgi:V/A-type H+-transporting ATPase subunit I